MAGNVDVSGCHRQVLLKLGFRLLSKFKNSLVMTGLLKNFCFSLAEKDFIGIESLKLQFCLEDRARGRYSVPE
jgi:hypothetical protein